MMTWGVAANEGRGTGSRARRASEAAKAAPETPPPRAENGDWHPAACPGFC
jgi:hypothetical protein